ncbi:MAG TPA: adenylyl-sulfate kinase [Verrucomicrobia bacterium]|nr:adenylyl-sulfate kinase [Verrucomicrobiota bacterium]
MNTPKSENIVWSATGVTDHDRRRVLRQRGCVLWLTGLSGSGKSTIARALELRLLQDRHTAYVLDGDNIRHGLNVDLDFSPAARTENIRRVAEVAALLADAGLITITAFISPYQADRQKAREIVTASTAPAAAPRPGHPFFEIFVNTPLAVCEQRDPKSLYARARAGLIPEFTGISAPFEAPTTPELVLHTEVNSVASCVAEILSLLNHNGIY